ncbi:MAG: CotH kinase family protein [Muribaculaceae bacterium]|nr:CotH kinase family protein [Muribaculaceae bacterium]
MSSTLRHIARYVCQWLMLAMLSLCPLQGASQLYIDGKPAFSDSTSNIILYSLPKECFGNDFTATVQLDTATHWNNITVNGKSLTNNPITFNDIAGDKSYLIRAVDEHGPIVKRLQFTFLPIISIEGDIGYDYTDAHVTLFDPDGKLDQAMTALVKWRGGYTNTEGRHKRNYGIKFVDENGEKQDRKLLGMRRDNHWKLDASQVDLSRVRNRVATDLWLDMAREPYYFNQAPDALTAARGKMVEVFCDGKYMGIYSLMECIDRKQLQIRKYDEDTKQVHGMLWNAATWSRVTEFRQYVDYDNNSPYYDGFIVEYPDFEEINPTHHEDLYNAVKFIATCNVYAFNDHAHEYLDMPVMIDYAIFTQFLISVDNGANNIYWAIYDRELDKKLTLAAWDLDWSLGTNRDSPDFHGGRAEPDYDYKFSSRQFILLRDERCIYNRDMVERYWELRNTWLSEKSLTDRVNNLVDQLIECGAVAREEARWSGDSDINGLPLDIKGERDYINDWIKKRLAHLDRTLMRHPCDVDSDGTVTSADIIAICSYLLEGTDHGYHLDVDGDGYVTVVDLNCVYKYLLGN